jgi:BASS family bile acid:Na+ symporter
MRGIPPPIEQAPNAANPAGQLPSSPDGQPTSVSDGRLPSSRDGRLPPSSSTPSSLPVRLLALSARRGSLLLAVGIFGGVASPALAAAFKGVIAPTVLMMMTLVLLRVDLAGTLAHLRRPVRTGAIIAFLLLACPVLTWAVVAPMHLDAGITAGLVIFATGCAATSSPAFARMVGLDPELSLAVTLATTFLVPLTAPPMVLLLLGVDLSIGTGAFMVRLGLIVGLPMLLSLLLRRLLGPARLLRRADALDGLLVWLVVFYGFAVMDGLGARMAADPGWVMQAVVAAFAVDYGLNLLTAGAFAGFGAEVAATAGLMSGNRNMALYLAVLPAAADPRVALFFGICQFPLFLSPFLLRPLYRRLVPAAQG